MDEQKRTESRTDKELEQNGPGKAAEETEKQERETGSGAENPAEWSETEQNAAGGNPEGQNAGQDAGQDAEQSIEESAEQEETSGYEFLKETIKQKPMDKRKLARQAARLAGSGAVFGLAAALVFALVAPGIERRVEDYYQDQSIRYPDPDGEETEAEPVEEEQQAQEEEEAEETPQTTTVIQELTLEDFEQLYAEMFQAAGEAKKALVTVIGSQNDKDWFQTPYESQISGLIVAESGQELYILTEYRIVENVDRIQVVFCNGTMTDARFQKSVRIPKMPSALRLWELLIM